VASRTPARFTTSNNFMNELRPGRGAAAVVVNGCLHVPLPPRAAWFASIIRT